MKPKPFWPLNHFTTPVAISVSPSGYQSIHAPRVGGEIKISERVVGSSGAEVDYRGWIAGEPKRFSMGVSFHEFPQATREFWEKCRIRGDIALIYL
jgi:hypothetical protein